MKTIKHFGDVFITLISYIALIGTPITVLLVILRVVETPSGWIDLFLVIACVTIFFIAKVFVREARIAHNRGERAFLR